MSSTNVPEDESVADRIRSQLAKYRRWREAQERGDPAPLHTELKQRSGVPYLEAALRRIEEGTYGICIDCGESISTQRLEAVIGAIRCADCQTEAEAKLRNRGFFR